MPIITRFGGSGGGTPIVCPYPHVWECTVVQSGTIGVVSGVVNLEPYDILHYTMPLGFSTYTLMIGGTTYTTSFLNDGEMYIQWDGNDFVIVAANGACPYPHVWTSPTYTITGSVLEITGGVDNLATDDIIVLTLASGESASVIEYNSTNYVLDYAVDDQQTYYVMFNGSSFNRLNDPPFNFVGNATVADVASGKTFYSSSSTLLTGSYVPPTSIPTPDEIETQTVSMSGVTSSGSSSFSATFTNADLSKSALIVYSSRGFELTDVTISGQVVTVKVKGTSNETGSGTLRIEAYEFDNSQSITRSLGIADTTLSNSLCFISNANCRGVSVERWGYACDYRVYTGRPTAYVNIIEF